MNKQRIDALNALNEANKQVVLKIQDHLDSYNDKVITATECHTKIKDLFRHELQDEQIAFDSQIKAEIG